MIYVWSIFAIVMVVIEIASTGILQIWFAIGAVVAAIIAKLFPGSYLVQLIVFFSVSGVLAFIGSRILGSKDQSQMVGSNPVYSILGKEAIVTKDIDTVQGVGQISINGDIWSAKSKTDEIIPEKTKVKVLDIEGVKAVVEPIND